MPAIIFGEFKAIKLAQVTFVCSDEDRNYLSKLYRTKRVLTIPNSVSIPEETAIQEILPNVLFLGTYLYRPSIDAAEYLIASVWPEVLKRCPQACLYIAGAFPEEIPSFSRVPKNVIFTGFVDDVAEEYNKVGILCSPIFMGGGTRIKIIEAAAYGKALVSTKIGAEGLDFTEGKEIFIRDTLEGLVECCVQLIESPELRIKMGKEARERAQALYDQNAIIRLIQKEFFMDVKSTG